MHRSLVIALVLVVGCDRDDRDPGDTEPPPGHLEYDSEVTDIYRDGKRIEVVPVSEPSSDRRCGYLTERALRDLQSTIDALDPSVDYDFELGDEECGWSESPAAQIHLEGFEHSPFSCDEFCCRPELAMVPSVYFLVLNNLDGMAPIVDGEPYVAVEPDEPCP